MSLSAMVRALVDADVRFVIFGGYAGMLHGSPRMTNDIDICYDREPGNLKRLASALASLDAYPREMEPGLPWQMDAQTLRMTTILTLLTREGLIDVFAEVPGVGDYAACEADSEWIDFMERKVRILSLRGLIASKKVAGRKFDTQDILTYEHILKLKGGTK